MNQISEQRLNGNASKLSLEERILLSFARDPNEPEIGATASYTLDNCLDFARMTIAGFDDLTRGRRVLDYGCGPGFQSVAMRVRCNAASVFGLDVVDDWMQVARDRAKQAGCEQEVKFGTEIPAGMQGQFDVVLSLSALEHYSDPEGEVQKMRRQLKPGGVILLAFAEPWYCHSGSHFNGYTKLPLLKMPIPWLNLFFSDRAMLTLRSRFRSDLPQRIEDISGGLNRMTVARFERIIEGSGMKAEQVRLFSTLGLPFVTRMPVLRELLTSAASCVLRAS